MIELPEGEYQFSQCLTRSGPLIYVVYTSPEGYIFSDWGIDSGEAVRKLFTPYYHEGQSHSE